jgi:uncharacterized coiled-coil protein SlyX
VSEPRLTPEREAEIRRVHEAAVNEDCGKYLWGKSSVGRLLAEIDALRAELERTRVSLHVEAAAADAEATFANELNADVAELRARVAELKGALREVAGRLKARVTDENHEAEPDDAIAINRAAALLAEPPK